MYSYKDTRNSRNKSYRSSNDSQKRDFRSNSYRGSNSSFGGNRRKRFAGKLTERELINSISQSQKDVETQNQKEHEVIIINTFENFNLERQVLANIKYKNFTKPSPIQDKAIPEILNDKDIIGIANTGTGKTAAFLIPLINKVYKNRNQKVLIVSPTRELAEQIYNAFRDLSFNTGIYSALIIGGSSMGKQISSLRRDPSFVIATPGRLKDFVNRNRLDLSQFNNVVLDEADRMVDIGFVEEIKFIVAKLPSQRQSLFFSATISNKVQDIINSFVKNPVTINVKSSESISNIKQEIVVVNSNKNKDEVLHNLLTQEGFNKVIVFGNTKWKIQTLTQELIKKGLRADAIHGDKKQSQRRTILEKFKRNEISILLATDVASRGLDIKNVSHVINYELPQSYEDYIHRIGRTGRAEEKGIALTFVNSY